MMTFRLPLVLALAAPLTLFACSDDGSGGDTGGSGPASTADQPLTDLEALFDGVPANDTIPEDGKFDTVYPPQFDVTDTLTPVRSQGARGTCSIFATVALMEQLYAAEGTISEPDFSEQFLQWSTKVELGIFQNTAGSNAGRNLDAVHRFGVVTEEVHPYESSQWGTAEDPACTGENQPTRCYTNGDPSEEVLAAQRYTLPSGRYVNCRPRSVKAYMTEKAVGVIASVEFFYQAWNHGGSELTTSSAYSRAGYVNFPSQADIEDSQERPAGHAILLVGWDDELEVPMLDADGEPMLDDNGDPVVERGFYLFKNSWGTGRFGTENPFGAGLGWISQRYIEEYGSCYSSTVPELVTVDEVCNNRIDDDGDDAVDCDDPDCASFADCLPEDTTNGPGGDIPDNDPNGFRSTLLISDEGIVDTVHVSVDITHSYRGDLRIALRAPSGAEAILRDQQGGSEDNLSEIFQTNEFAGVPAAGEWTLIVSDLAAADTGSLDRWSLSFTLGGEATPEICGNGLDDDANGDTDCEDSACSEEPACATDVVTYRYEGTETGLAIPDNDAEGIDDIVEATDSGVISAVRLSVEIQHPNRGDLQVTLENSERAVVLFDQEEGDADDLVRTFTTDAFAGDESADLWLLTVADLANLDEGTLLRWSLEIDVVAE